MKNIYILIAFGFLALGLSSCEEETKNPLYEPEVAAYVFIDIESPVLDVTDIANSTFGGVVTAPANNVESFTVKARRVSNGIASNYATVFTTSTFPVDMRISGPDIADALGIDTAELAAGDRFDFVGTSVGTDGSIVTFNSLAPDIQAEPGQKQAYALTAFIACPFNQADMIGTYTFIEDSGFSATGKTTFDIIAGDTPNEIVLVNPFDSAGNYNITVNVNDFGIATFERQDAVLTSEICCAGYSPTNIRSSSAVSLALSCIGYIELKYSTALSLAGGTGTGFTFGDQVLIAQKN
ncbi:hypothetical protein [Cellulophaga tyrosinoxydans]|uniref:Uncharacterized protein n=1 Tax=Cellulophaga tyrosinoxydans TaxID=504486 RepID=A0A1W2AUB3_9FLAO|nr:hypothetical protein [Cellulophaga tyrosinoxydans]SMC64293.1 hypothetical protein SAMN05660703_2234 [Cellulophaga tyrosinoxydans]